MIPRRTPLVSIGGFEDYDSTTEAYNSHQKSAIVQPQE